jgi:hypothetical protein
LLQTTPVVERTSEWRAQSSIEPIALADVESTEVHSTIAVWHKWRGLHAIPSHDRLDLRDFGRYLENVSIIQAEDNGAEYAFLAIGAAHVRAYGSNFTGQYLRHVIAIAPKFGKLLKASCDLVRTTGRPYAFRGIVGSNVAESRFSSFETCYLPVGSSATSVSHILNAASYAIK